MSRDDADTAREPERPQDPRRRAARTARTARTGTGTRKRASTGTGTAMATAMSTTTAPSRHRLRAQPHYADRCVTPGPPLGPAQGAGADCGRLHPAPPRPLLHARGHHRRRSGHPNRHARTRARGHAEHDPDIGTFDVVEVTLADDPERDDLAQPEATTVADLPRHVGTLRGRQLRKLLRTARGFA